MAHLNENNYEEIINGYSKNTWIPIFELIEKIENSENFGELEINDKSIIPHYTLSSVVSEFMDLVYKIPLMISYDWMKWKEGETIFKDKNFNYDTIDIPTKCKIISALVRSDRFNEGVLINSFEDETIIKILKSIQFQVSQK